MTLDLADLRRDLVELEQRVETSLKAQRLSAQVGLAQRRAEIEAALRDKGTHIKVGLLAYLRGATWPTLLTGPFIYGMIVPIALLDLSVVICQAVCFRVWGVQRAKRRDYIVIDHQLLGYLNAIEKLNCIYCGYANGVIAFAREVASRTEQFWCPIKHATRPAASHDHYNEFLDYGDAEGWQSRLDALRRKIS